MEWISILIATILGLKVLAEAVVNLTDTPHDDEVVGKVYAIVEKVAGIWNAKKAKQLPGEVLVSSNTAF